MLPYKCSNGCYVAAVAILKTYKVLLNKLETCPKLLKLEMYKKTEGMVYGADDIKLPPEFSGPAQFLLYTRYGDPRELGWKNKWLTNWDVQSMFSWFPIRKITIHKHFWPLLDAAFRKLTDTGLYKEIKSIDGCHNLHNLNGSEVVLSVHSWGAALDMNKPENPVGSIGNWSDEFIKTMERYNIYCGQSWIGHTEPMHFSMVNGA